MKSVKRALTHATAPWLLIFDNVDDPRLLLTPYFPEGDRGNIIITSRNPECQQYNTVGSKNVGQMMAAEAVALLAKTVYGTSDLQNKEDEGGREVAEKLGCLALAIVQAGAYIRETSCSFNNYLTLYYQRRELVLTYLPQQYTGTDYRYTVYATWQVSLNMIESKQDATSKHALELQKILCFYHHDRVPMQMFYNTWYNLREDPNTSDALLWPQSGLNFFDYRQAVQASVTLLASFSLVTREANALLSMHPLVNDWCQNQVAVNGKQARCQQAISLLARSVAWKFKTDDYNFRRSLVSHIHACLRVPEYCDTAADQQVMRDWPVLALILGENGSTQDAIALLEQTVALRKSQLGEEHPDTLASMYVLAVCYSEVGRQDEGLRLTEQLGSPRKTKLGKEHPHTLKSVKWLAYTRQQGPKTVGQPRHRVSKLWRRFGL